MAAGISSRPAAWQAAGSHNCAAHPCCLAPQVLLPDIAKLSANATMTMPPMAKPPTMTTMVSSAPGFCAAVLTLHTAARHAHLGSDLLPNHST
jgi:hypothetical protein